MRTQSLVVPATAAVVWISIAISTRIGRAEPSVDPKTGKVVVPRDRFRWCAKERGDSSSLDVRSRVAVIQENGSRCNNRPVGDCALDRLASHSAYVARATTRDGLVGYRDCSLIDDTTRHDIDLTVLETAVIKLHVRDESGKPVRGTSIWSISHNGPNGSMWFAKNRNLFEAFELPVKPSDESGELLLPELPAGKIDVKLMHPDYAPCELKRLRVDRQTKVEATLPAGVKLTFKVEMEGKPASVSGLEFHLGHYPDEHPSSLAGPLPDLRPDGTAPMTVSAGKYTRLRLTHPDYVVTPEYLSIGGHGPAGDREYFDIGPGADLFTFQIHRKLKVRGRAVDASSRKPVANVSVYAFLEPAADNSPFARFAKEKEVGFAEANDRGEFDIDLAAGKASLMFGSGDYVWPPRYRVDVAAGQSALDHDILIKPIPKLRGLVEDENGKPLAGAVVRFRGSELNDACRSAVSDSQGRFEMSPPFIPVDWKTEEPKPRQTLVAFHPYQPLGGELEINLGAASTALENVVLRMKPQEFGALVTGYPSELTPRERGIVASDEKEHLAAISLAGKLAPELDGAAWLNSPKPKMSLTDFRAKFVLLQFWTTWCGACHSDLPNVKLARDLYESKGLVVIGVHDNSMPLDAIKEDAAKNGMTWPIVVDQTDGRILANYQDRGFSGFPSYILIGPDGTVIKDDETVASPNLFNFKVEVIRQFVMSRRNDDR